MWPILPIRTSRIEEFVRISGKITFTSHTPGEHTICLYSNSSAWFSGSQLRVHMDIQVGEHAIDYAQVEQKEKMSDLQLRIRQLINQVDQITKEQNYQRVRLRQRASAAHFSPRFFFDFSTARSDSVRLARAQTSASCGGRSLSSSSSSEWASGK